MTPHLVKWHNEYRDKGLTIIEVFDGRMDALSDVESHASAERLPFTVVHDEGGAATERYDIAAYPTAYLLGADGKVVWQGHPHGREEEQIRKALQGVTSSGG